MLDLTNPQEVMAGTAWGEARGEGVLAMHGVISVIMNRVDHPSWMGHSVIDVCLKPEQFSCWNLDDPNREKVLDVTPDDPQFVEAMALAQKALNRDLPDITNGANSYYDTSIATPEWAVGQPAMAIANLRFLKAK